MPSHVPSINHRIEYAGWRAISVLPRLLPRRALVISADAIGWVLYRVMGVRRAVIDSQLEMAFPEKSSSERTRIGLQSWQNCVLTFFEFLDPREAKFVEQEGYEEWCKPLNPYQAIVITGHIGNWEAMGSLSRRENIKIAAVGKAMHNPLVDAEIVKGRLQRGLEVLQLKSSMKSIVDAVRAGKWIAILGDQDARRHGIFVPFFGQLASTAAGPAMFSWKLNLPLLPVFCVRLRDKNRSLKLIFRPAIVPNPQAERDPELERLTILHTQALEEVVRRYPENYFWLHRRWKTRPKIRRAKAVPIQGPPVPTKHP